MVICLSTIAIFGQQPKAVVPVEYKLNPEASKVFANIDKAEAELQRQWQTLESQRAMLLIGANDVTTHDVLEQLVAGLLEQKRLRKTCVPS